MKAAHRRDPKITDPSQRWRPTAEQQSVLLEEAERTGGGWGGRGGSQQL